MRDKYKTVETTKNPVIDPEEWFNPISVVLRDGPVETEWKIPPRWQNILGKLREWLSESWRNVRPLFWVYKIKLTLGLGALSLLFFSRPTILLNHGLRSSFCFQVTPRRRFSRSFSASLSRWGCSSIRRPGDGVAGSRPSITLTSNFFSGMAV